MVEERLRSLDPASADPSSAADLLGLLASVLQNACMGRVAADYADGPSEAMQDCVRLAGAMVSWMAQGGASGVASAAPDACSHLKDFVAAALQLASHAFFSPEWYQQLGPGRYVQAGNAVRGYVRDLAPVALDATEACWRAVEQQLACGDPTGEELLEACRALFGALFEGLRHLGITSAERINDPSVPREMRSFAGLNILWTGLSRVMTALPPEALQQLLNGCAVQSVLRALLGYLAAEVRAMASSSPGDYETRLKVSRFWLQHAARVAQAHPAAAAACWDELASAAAEVHGHMAACAAAATTAAAKLGSAAPEHQQQQRQYQQLQAQIARDIDSAIACKMTSVLAMVLDAGEPRGKEADGGGAQEAAAGRGGQQQRYAAAAASPQQLEARLAKLEELACSVPAATPAGAATAPSPAGAVLLCLALLQRAAHVSPEARTVMAARSLPWAGVAATVDLYGMALEQCGLAAVTPSLDLPHQLAAAALALLAAAAEQQAGGQDGDTFAAGCAVVCNWGACAHPLLSAAAADVLSTLVQHCEPALASRLIAAVARLAGLAAAAEAAAAAAAAAASGSDDGAEAFPSCGAGGRLERLLACMLSAAPPQAEPGWQEVLEQLAPPPFQNHPPHSSSPQNNPPVAMDLCATAGSRVLWGAAAGAAAAQAATARGAGGVQPSGPAVGIAVSEQELGARARQLLSAVRQAAAVLGSLNSCTAGGGGATAATSGPAAAPSAVAQQWLAQLLGCLEVTVIHVRHVDAPGLHSLVSEAANLAAELLQALSPEPPVGGSAATCAVTAVAPAHAAARLIARTADCLSSATLAVLAPMLTRLAQQGSPVVAADVAVVAAYCNSPPPEALFHALLRNPHATVMHAALQSQVHVCRAVPPQYAASVRRLFPPDTAAPPPHHGQPQPPGAPPAYLAAAFKSYMARKVSDEEAAVVTGAAMQTRAAEGTKLAGAARESCVAESALGRPLAPLALRRGVRRGVEALQACMATLSVSQSGGNGSLGDAEPMATDAAGRAHDPYSCTRGATQQQQQQQQQQPGLSNGSSGGGPLSAQVADDNAAMNVLRTALGGLERSLGALHAAVLAQGVNAGRLTDWDQLQVHARALLGDLSSATSRIRNMNELLYALQGR